MHLLCILWMIFHCTNSRALRTSRFRCAVLGPTQEMLVVDPVLSSCRPHVGLVLMLDILKCNQDTVLYIGIGFRHIKDRE